MDIKKRTRITTQCSSTTPFTATGLITKYRKWDTVEKKMVDPDTGQFYALRPLEETSVSVDSASFSKVFHQGIDQLLQSDLTLSAFKLLMYIVRNLKPKKSYIEIDVEDCFRACKWKSAGVFNSSARELTSKGFINKSTKGKTVYWINPDYFFNGNRRILFEAQATKEQ